MNGRTSKLLRRVAKLAGALYGANAPAAHLPTIKRSWHATPRPERHETRQTLQRSLAKAKENGLG